MASTLFLGPNLLAGGFCLARGAAVPSFLVSTLRGAAVLLPVFLWSFRQSRREQTALQYNEWHAIPYAPEKLPQFTKQIDREEES